MYWKKYKKKKKNGRDLEGGWQKLAAQAKGGQKPETKP